MRYYEDMAQLARYRFGASDKTWNTDAVVFSAIAEIQHLLSKYVECVRRTSSTTTTATADSVTLPDDCLAVDFVYINNTPIRRRPTNPLYFKPLSYGHPLEYWVTTDNTMFFNPGLGTNIVFNYQYARLMPIFHAKVFAVDEFATKTITNATLNFSKTDTEEWTFTFAWKADNVADSDTLVVDDSTTTIASIVDSINGMYDDGDIPFKAFLNTASLASNTVLDLSEFQMERGCQSFKDAIFLYPTLLVPSDFDDLFLVGINERLKLRDGDQKAWTDQKSEFWQRLKVEQQQIYKKRMNNTPGFFQTTYDPVPNIMVIERT